MSLFLFDLLTRQQVLLDRVGVYFMEWSDSQYSQIMQQIKQELSNTSYSNLDSLSKIQLNALIFKLRKIQITHYDKYTDDLLKMLQLFTMSHLGIVKRTQAFALNFDLIGEAKSFSDSESESFIKENKSDSDNLYPMAILGLSDNKDDEKTFKTFVNALSGASGLSILQMLKNIKQSSIASVESAIRQAWANKKTISDLIATLTGAKSEETGNNTVTKSSNGARNAVFTFVQQIAQSVTSGIQSVIYKKYVWVSILDSRTSAICRSLNGKIFVFGQGPVPPAHYHCRSHIVALGADDDGSKPYGDNQTYAEWLSKQPNYVKKKLSQSGKPLSVEDYGNSDNILTAQ